MDIFKKANKDQDVKELIEQIHKEFECAGEKLLAEAVSILDEIEKHNFSKGELLKELGFTSAQECVEIESFNKKKEETELNARMVREYSFKYPNNKFITEEMVKEICNKYNLVCGDVDLYKGFVPEKNLREIAKFKIKEEDIQHARIIRGSIKYISKKDYDHAISNPYLRSHALIDISYQKLTKLKICAPIKDMETKDMELDGVHLKKHIPDPIVLHHVNNGYLILTAWGEEASDPIIVNHKFN